MKNYLLTVLLLLIITLPSKAKSTFVPIQNNLSAFTNDHATSIAFPAGYVVGDYIEFVRVSPSSASASGFYQISISYTRDGVAAAATHLASISHANPSLWRETGRINNNPYVGSRVNFTVDCNTQDGNSRFRIRAINTYGVTTDNLVVNVKITSLNFNSSYAPIDVRGNDLTVVKFLPMTSDWDLYVGNLFSTDGATLAIKAIQNGNVGIGTATPDSKLTVNGNIHAKEVKIDLSIPAPDYVFANDYKLKTLQELEDYIKANSHLPEIPSAKEFEKNGVLLAAMNMSLLKKIEELTLYMIEQNKAIIELQKEVKMQKQQIKK